ncbi:hypothetical protein APHAL10511_002875 [Amanita phalloides]|nr:hypothetical protein APHAL10511_002875 [Amanita phalloides]
MVQLLLVILLLCNLVTSASLRFQKCFWNVLNATSLEGVVYSNGSQATNLTLGTGLAYHRCIADCGAGPSPFDWYTFSTQSTSWLLPLLALIPQIPYGTKDGLSNFLAVLLTVGSPTLAAYSLSLTVISHRWMVKRFERSNYYNSHLAARILGDLQQVSLKLPEDESVIPSLIVLERNRDWWKKLSDGLDYSVPKWTVASIVSIIYVVLADAFSWSNSLEISLAQTAANGEGISSLWLCFLPIVIGNLQISPKSDTHRIRKAFDAANDSFYIATDEDVPRQVRADSDLSINIRESSKNAIDEDEICSAPIFFYARVLSCIHVADQMASAFDAASRHASDHRQDGTPPSRKSDVIEYCKSEVNQVDGYSYEIFSIFLRSAFLANFLQWGTTGATIMAIYLTPTKGQLILKLLHPR